MTVIVLKRQQNKAHTADLLASDTAEIPGTMVISGAALAGTEVLRVVGETRIEGTLHGVLNGSGLVIGVAGASSNTGSALQIASFTTTQRGNLAPAAGMGVYNTTLGWFNTYNGTRWGDSAINNNFQASAVPTTSNDGTQGYTFGSLWSLNVSPFTTYTCTSNATGAASWRLVTNSAEVQRDTFGQHFLGSRMDYSASVNMTASEVQYTRVWLENGVVLNTAQVFLNSNATGNINIGLYDQATPTSNAGTPRNLVASTGSTALVTTGAYANAALSSPYTVAATGYYWVAVIGSSGTPHYAGSATYRSGYLDSATNPALRFEAGSGVTLPTGPSHSFASAATNSIVYASVLE